MRSWKLPVDVRAAARAGRRASRAGSRSSCPRARRGTGRRRAAARRRPCSSQKSSAAKTGSPDCGIVEVEIGLMGVEAMPVVRLGDRIPGPVRGLEVLEDDARVAVALGRVAPDVEVAPAAARRRAPRALEPGVLVGGVVDDQLGDHAQPAAMRLAQERAEVLERAVVRMHARGSRRCRSRRRAAATGRTAAARAR